MQEATEQQSRRRFIAGLVVLMAGLAVFSWLLYPRIEAIVLTLELSRVLSSLLLTAVLLLGAAVILPVVMYWYSLCYPEDEPDEPAGDKRERLQSLFLDGIGFVIGAAMLGVALAMLYHDYSPGIVARLMAGGVLLMVGTAYILATDIRKTDSNLA